MFEKLISAVGLHLSGNKIPYMIIGGQAVLLYGIPGLTRDVDDANFNDSFSKTLDYTNN